MTPEQWKQLKYFKPTENWGNPDLMDAKLIQTLDVFREYVSTPILVTRGTQGISDAKDSQHQYGRAVDIMFPQVGLGTLFDLMLQAMRFKEFTGIGIYPDWELGGNGIRHGGLHLDVRPEITRAQWMGVKVDGKTTYMPLHTLNIKKFLL